MDKNNNLKNFILFLIMLLVAFGLATGVMHTIDYINLDLIDNVLEELVKLVPQEEIYEVLKKGLKDYQKQVEDILKNNLP
jgi:3-hydroxyacyl-CoA dehydrogenase